MAERDRTSPDGCRWCGIARREHSQEWFDGVGYHQWVAPTTSQRLSRMRARRTRAALR